MTFNFVAVGGQTSPPLKRQRLLLAHRSAGAQLPSTASLLDVSQESVAAVTRPIHYLGSKLRIVDSVREAVDRVDPSYGPVCDLFAGSGTVSRALSISRAVTAVDTQEYSRVLCSALLQPPRFATDELNKYLETTCRSHGAQRLAWAFEPMVAHEATCRRKARAGMLDPICELLENGSVILFEQDPSRIKDGSLRLAMSKTLSRMKEAGSIRQRRGLAARYFGGVYFSYFQACQIDMLSEAVESLPLAARDTVLAAILSTTSDLVNTVGKQFAQPIRPRNSDGSPKAHLAERVARDRDTDGIEVFTKWIARYLALPSSTRKHRVFRCDYREALGKLKGEVSVVYADPPYTRDHYSRFYHVLETLCLRDFPEVSTVRIGSTDQMSRGVYRVERYQSPFCIKSKAPEAFAALFSDVRQLRVPLVVSYSPFKKDSGARPRLVSIEQLVTLAKKSFRSVEVVAAARMAHSKLNRTDKNQPMSFAAETFVVCKP